MAIRESDAKATNIPLRVFLYTTDQIAMMIGVQEKDLLRRFLHFDGRTAGFQNMDQMKAVNINSGDENAVPEWRVADKEFIRWLKRKGFRVVERGWVDSR